MISLGIQSGGGIKNKLLEAASMGKAMVGSSSAASGLRFDKEPPLLVARTADEWIQAIRALWSSAGQRRRLGQAARVWVTKNHDWQAAARQAAASVESALRSQKVLVTKIDWETCERVLSPVAKRATLTRGW